MDVTIDINTLLTGITALVTAIGGIYIAIRQAGQTGKLDVIHTAVNSNYSALLERQKAVDIRMDALNATVLRLTEMNAELKVEKQAAEVATARALPPQPVPALPELLGSAAPADVVVVRVQPVSKKKET